MEKPKSTKSVPYAIYEQEQIRSNGIISKLWVIAIILIVALIATNLAWLIYEKQFEVVEETTTTSTTSKTTEYVDVTQDNEEGDNNYIGRDGDITYGETTN